MSLGLSQEQPPLKLEDQTDYEDLRDFLVRRFVDIDSSLRQSSKFPVRKEMPYKPQTGDMHYFGNPATHNYDAAILTEGFWGLNEAVGWTKFDAGIPGVTDHGLLTGLGDDDHTQYALLTGRPGGQTLFGGTVSGDDIDIAGSVGPNPGFVNLNSPVIFGPYTANPAAAYGFDYSVTDNPVGTFVGGGLNFSGNITTGGATFIYESFRGAPTITTGSVLGFAAYTVLQALPSLKAGAASNHHPLSPIILNAGANIQNDFSGTRTVNAVQGVSFASRMTTTVSGAVLNCGDWIGLTVAPTWSTVSGSTINFGNVIGVDVKRPAQSLFGGSGGIERMNSFHGLKVANPGINNGFGTMPCSAVRSEITIGTNRYFLLNNGTAPSDMGAAHMYFDDNFGVAYGGNGITNFDYWESWNAAGYQRKFFLSTSSALRWSSPSNNRFLFDNDGGSASGEYNFNCHKFSFGANVGPGGNNVGQFVTPARTTQVNGGWTDFALTHSANLTVNNTMGDITGWTINAPSIVLGTGTVTGAGVLDVGGNVTQGSVNRFGVRILSNPAGGSGVNAALWVTAGRSQFDGFIDINKPIALGGGAVATLGTIGATGPAAAAQAQWVEIEINGVRHWLPAWT